MFAAIYFQPVFGKLKPHFAGYFLYQPLQLLAFEFVDLAGFNIH